MSQPVSFEMCEWNSSSENVTEIFVSVYSRQKDEHYFNYFKVDLFFLRCSLFLFVTRLSACHQSKLLSWHTFHYIYGTFLFYYLMLSICETRNHSPHLCEWISVSEYDCLFFLADALVCFSLYFFSLSFIRPNPKIYKN